jgi:hypothetical protein
VTRLHAELLEILEFLEEAAHSAIPEAAQYAANGDPEDTERWYCAEQLLLVQRDLQRLRPVLEELIIDLGEDRARGARHQLGRGRHDL